MAGKTESPPVYYPHLPHLPTIAEARGTVDAVFQGAYDTDPVERGRMNQGPFSDLSHEKTTLIPANDYSKDVTKSKSIPWYPKTKGLAIIIVGTLAVVGVIVGVAFGVTRSKNNGPASVGPVSGTNGGLTEVTTTKTPATTTAPVTTTTRSTTMTPITTTASIRTTAPITTTTPVATSTPVTLITTATTTDDPAVVVLGGAAADITGTTATTTNKAAVAGVGNDGHAIYDEG